MQTYTAHLYDCICINMNTCLARSQSRSRSRSRSDSFLAPIFKRNTHSPLEIGQPQQPQRVQTIPPPNLSALRTSPQTILPHQPTTTPRSLWAKGPLAISSRTRGRMRRWRGVFSLRERVVSRSVAFFLRLARIVLHRRASHHPSSQREPSPAFLPPSLTH